MPKFIPLDSSLAAPFDLPDGLTRVGRRPTNELDFVHGTVSGEHARVTRNGEDCYLEDLESRNGTFVNGQRIAGQVLLRPGDVVEFGEVRVRFEADASSPSPPPAEESRPAVPEPSTADAGFQVDFGAEDQQFATIQGSLAGGGRFGVLEAQPAAKLKAILDISTSLADTVDLQAMLPKILDTLFGVFAYADRGCILLMDEASGEMLPRAFKHRRAGEDATVRLSRAVVNKVLQEKTGVLSADAATDEQFSQSQSIADLKIRSMMCVPMLGLDGEPRGIISIDSQNPLGHFKQDDLELLMAVAGQAALSYETARLMQVYAEKQQQDNEMAIARDVQRALLPPKLPDVPGYDFYASYDAAYAVGGDYYDSFLLPGNKICLSFGDVAGKGVPGAIIMSRLSSCVESTIKFSQEVGEAIQAINNHMCHPSLEGRFVTYVLMIIDLNTHQMSFANAGHMSPLIRRADGTLEDTDSDKVGPPIGVVEDFPYEVDTITLQPGDTVVVVTDGVDEAMNSAGELYTTERMVEFVRQGPKPAGELGRALLADVRRHADGHPQSDDITIMTFGRNRLNGNGL